ncbi:MAG: dirigent protein [Proteobacteria bacterium]|nr:dirigent protein [Pseudomonadota bacterium]
MHKPATLILSFAALIGAAPATCFAARTLHWVERATHEHVVDIAPAGDSLGDLLTFVNPLYDAANDKQVGDSNGYCVRTEVGKSWQCTWTTHLQQGELAVSGTYADEGDSTFIIVGGSGAFAGARGSLKVHARDAGHTTYDFTANLL